MASTIKVTNHPLLSVPTGTLQVPASAPPATEIFPDATVGNLSPNLPSNIRSIKLSLIIPTYNERDNVTQLITQLTQLLNRVIPAQYELIVVDDDSPDRTWKVAQALTGQYPHLRVMRRQQERGLSSAVIRGWQVAQGEILGVIDADLQHPPEVLLDLLQQTLIGADLSVASRNVEEGGVSDWSILRRFLSRGAQVVGLVLCPWVVGRVSDPMSGYFMVRRSAISGRTLSPLGYKILLEVLGRGSVVTITETGYVFQERQSGVSKVAPKQYFEYLGHLIRLRSSSQFIKGRQKFPVERFVRYGLVGFSGIFIDMAILYLLTTALGWGLIYSKIVAAEIAIISNFLWNDAWTYADVVQRQKGWRSRFKRLLKFNTVCLVGLILDVLLLNAVYNLIFGQRLKYVANLIAIGLVAIWNFWINFKLSWRVTAPEGAGSRC